MADIFKPLNELARLFRFNNKLISPHKIIIPHYETVTLAGSAWTAPAGLRSVTFVLWGIDASNTAVLTLPDETKTFALTRYEGYAFTYAIDVNRDCSIDVTTVSIDVTGTAQVDVVYTVELCKSIADAN